MNIPRRDMYRELKEACIAAGRQGLTIPEIDVLPEVDTRLSTLYPIRHLVRMARHGIIRTYLEADVDEHGVRNLVSLEQKPLFVVPDEETGEKSRATNFVTFDKVKQDKARMREGLYKMRKRISGIIRKTPLLTDEMRLEFISAIDAMIETYIERLA